MKPFRNLAEASTPDGVVLSLHEHDGKFYLRNDGRDLMSTRNTFSEEFLAELGCAKLMPGTPSRPGHPNVLIGGLGLGFTLKRCLEVVGSPATVRVAELVPEIIGWNRSFLVESSGPLLDDERTDIYEGDVFDCLGECDRGAFDAILLDIDDTPDSLVIPKNVRLYTPGFLRALHDALVPGGRVAFWFAEPTSQFPRELRKAGFSRVDETLAKPHKNARRARHVVYVGDRRK